MGANFWFAPFVLSFSPFYAFGDSVQKYLIPNFIALNHKILL